MPVVSDYTAILGGGGWNAEVGRPVGQSITITYSLLSSVPAMYTADRGFGPLLYPETVATFRPFTTSEAAIVRDAFQQWASASGLVFIEVPSGLGDINISTVSFASDPFFFPPGTTGYAFYPGYDEFDQYGGGEIFIDHSAVNSRVIIHEIGHALGLIHTNEGFNTLHPSFDTASYTMMSYNGGGSTLGIFDVQAAQHLYGTTDFANLSSWSYDASTMTLTQVGLSGNDTIVGTSIHDVISGGSGNDVLRGFAGNDRLDGGDGNDILYGGMGDDVFRPGSGNDTIYGGDGGYTVFNGTSQNFIFDGFDIVDYATATSDIVGHLGRAVNDSSVGFYNFRGADIGVDVTTPTTSVSPFPDNALDGAILGSGNDLVNGSATNNRIWGGAGNDRLNGLAGNDTLDGEAGNDTLDGGLGDDRMIGGLGDDIYVVDSSADIVEEVGASGAGIDTVRTTLAQYFLGANIEALIATGTGSFTGGGNGIGNTLTGLVSGYNALYGGGGDDSLNGGMFEDVLVGDAGNDTLNGGDGGDILSELFDPLSSGNDVFNGGNGVDIMYAAAGNDIVSGGTDLANNYANLGDGDDSYQGSAGNDVVEGGNGVDTINGNNGDDSLYGDAGNDIINGGSGIDLLSGSTGDDQLNGGADNDLLIGDEGNDTLIGGAGVDVLYGFADNDVLSGGAGTDGLYGGSGADRFQYLSNAAGATDYDYLWDFSTAQGDVLSFSTSVFANQAAVLAASVVSGGNTTVTMGNGNFIVMVGVDIAALGPANYLFV